jgi:hypothetical protein
MLLRLLHCGECNSQNRDCLNQFWQFTGAADDIHFGPSIHSLSALSENISSTPSPDLSSRISLLSIYSIKLAVLYKRRLVIAHLAHLRDG